MNKRKIWDKVLEWTLAALGGVGLVALFIAFVALCCAASGYNWE